MGIRVMERQEQLVGGNIDWPLAGSQERACQLKALRVVEAAACHEAAGKTI